MSRIQTWATEPLQVYAVNSIGKPLIGLTDLFVRVRRDSDGFFLDWFDWTFKASGHIALDKPLVESSALRAPGLYGVLGGLNTALISNPSPDDNYTVIALQTPGTNAYLPGPGQISVGGWADIAKRVWDEPLGAHLIIGSTGAALNSVAFSTAGSKQVTLQIRGPLSLPLQGAQVDLYDATNVFFLARVFTGVTGNVNVALDPGTYSLRIFKTGYAFTVPSSLVVTVDAAVTYVGTSVTVIVPPSNPLLCAVYGTVRNVKGEPVENVRVTAYSATPQVVQGSQQHIEVGCTLTDGNGFFRLELERGAQVNFMIEDTGLDVLRTVPSTPTQDVASWV